MRQLAMLSEGNMAQFLRLVNPAGTHPGFAHVLPPVVAENTERPKAG